MISKEAQLLIIDNEFWKTIEFAKNILTPIATQIVEGQGEYYNTGACYFSYKYLSKLYLSKHESLKNQNMTVATLCKQIRG